MQGIRAKCSCSTARGLQSFPEGGFAASAPQLPCLACLAQTTYCCHYTCSCCSRGIHADCRSWRCAAGVQDLCREYNIPTGSYAVFSEPEPAKRYIREQGVPIVVKAVGLAAGKGVVVAHRLDEALAAVDDMLVQQKFGDAGHAPLLLCRRYVARTESQKRLLWCPHHCTTKRSYNFLQ